MMIQAVRMQVIVIVAVVQAVAVVVAAVQIDVPALLIQDRLSKHALGQD